MRIKIRLIIFIGLLSVLSIQDTASADALTSYASVNNQFSCDVCIACKVAIASAPAAGAIAIFTFGLSLVDVVLAGACTTEFATDSVLWKNCGTGYDYSGCKSVPGNCSDPNGNVITNVTLASHCCDPGQPSQEANPYPGDCPGTAPLSSAVAPVIQGNLAAAAIAIQQATGFNAPNAGVAPIGSGGAPSSEIESATQGGIVNSNPTSPSAGGGSLMNGLNGGGGGDNSASGASAGGLMALGGSPQPSASSTPTSRGVQADAEMGSYSTGGGFGTRRGLSKTSDQIINPIGGSTQNQDFSGDGSNSLNPVASEDPVDYFTRLSLDQNLFKIIHNRYVSVSSRWIQKDLHLLTPSK